MTTSEPGLEQQMARYSGQSWTPDDAALPPHLRTPWPHGRE